MTYLEEKPPAVIWLLSIPWLVLYILVAIATYNIVAAYTPGASIKYGVLEESYP